MQSSKWACDVNNNGRKGTGESSLLRKKQGMPGMSIIAGGRVKLQTRQAKNNEVACAKLQHQAVSELLPWTGVTGKPKLCVGLYKFFLIFLFPDVASQDLGPAGDGTTLIQMLTVTDAATWKAGSAVFLNISNEMSLKCQYVWQCDEKDLQQTCLECLWGDNDKQGKKKRKQAEL